VNGPIDSPLSGVARTIQLSVAPVFLLTALGTFLGVLSTRLARIVDRARVVGDRIPTAPDTVKIRLREEVKVLVRRRRFINAAITAGVTSALLVCAIISSLFIGSILNFHAAGFAAFLFVGAMIAFTIALLFFLREIMLALASVRID
jgi:hypothetical protein